VFEALDDLIDRAIFLDQFPTGLPEEGIITEWQNKDADDFLLPDRWAITALLGTSYTVSDPSGEYFVWTDIFPGAVRGDNDGDAEADAGDRQRVVQYILDNDDRDGVIDGRVVLTEFARDFSVFDANHSGVVDGLDQLLVSPPGDLDEAVVGQAQVSRRRQGVADSIGGAVPL